MRNPSEERLERTMRTIQIPFRPEAAVVLGSGLGHLAEILEIEARIPYAEIPGFPISTVQGHTGQFIFAKIHGIPTVLMQGRVHYYEGYSMEEVVLPIRLMRRMGTEEILLTNAAGGLHADWPAGTFMMITDQIASFVPSPLIGRNMENLGERFPDMSQIYDKELQGRLRRAAKLSGIALQEGTYIQMTGPNYESPAEVRMCALLGADAVGMSTACEVIAARHCGFRIAGISCITNPASGITDIPLSHEEVQAAANKAAEKFETLVLNYFKLRSEA